MRYHHKIIDVELAAHQQGVLPILVATSKELPRITAIMNHDGAAYNTIAVLDGVQKANIPKGFKQGFFLMFPLVIDMKEGQVLSVGFTNHTATTLTCQIWIQYYLV